MHFKYSDDALDLQKKKMCGVFDTSGTQLSIYLRSQKGKCYQKPMIDDKITFILCTELSSV